MPAISLPRPTGTMKASSAGACSNPSGATVAVPRALSGPDVKFLARMMMTT
jgi:hypothetical protein